MPMHQVYVEPQRERADVVVSGEADVGRSLNTIVTACTLLESVAPWIC
jgi:uridine kinase